MRIAAALLGTAVLLASASAMPASFSTFADIRGDLCNGAKPCEGGDAQLQFDAFRIIADADPGRGDRQAAQGADIRINDLDQAAAFFIGDEAFEALEEIPVDTLIAPREETGREAFATPVPAALPLILTGAALLGFMAARRNRA